MCQSLTRLLPSYFMYTAAIASCFPPLQYWEWCVSSAANILALHIPVLSIVIAMSLVDFHSCITCFDLRMTAPSQTGSLYQNYDQVRLLRCLNQCSSPSYILSPSSSSPWYVRLLVFRPHPTHIEGEHTGVPFECPLQVIPRAWSRNCGERVQHTSR